MLEQYRKDLPKEEKDFLPDSEAQGKRKLLFVLTGASLALVFFLFLMGVFRTDDETLVKENKPDAVTRENILALEDKLQALTARLDKIESDSLSIKPASQETHVNEVASQKPITNCGDAVQMMNGAIHDMISKQAEASEELVKQEQKKEAAHKVAKGKPKKAKQETVATHDANGMYVVQKGDTLSKISQRYFGTPNRWKAIYDANKEKIANINNLKVGTALVIPEAKQ